MNVKGQGCVVYNNGCDWPVKFKEEYDEAFQCSDFNSNCSCEHGRL